MNISHHEGVLIKFKNDGTPVVTRDEARDFNQLLVYFQNVLGFEISVNRQSPPIFLAKFIRSLPNHGKNMYRIYNFSAVTLEEATVINQLLFQFRNFLNLELDINKVFPPILSYNFFEPQPVSQKEKVPGALQRIMQLKLRVPNGFLGATNKELDLRVNFSTKHIHNNGTDDLLMDVSDVAIQFSGGIIPLYFKFNVLDSEVLDDLVAGRNNDWIENQNHVALEEVGDHQIPNAAKNSIHVEQEVDSEDRNSDFDEPSHVALQEVRDNQSPPASENSRHVEQEADSEDRNSDFNEHPSHPRTSSDIALQEIGNNQSPPAAQNSVDVKQEVADNIDDDLNESPRHAALEQVNKEVKLEDNMTPSLDTPPSGMENKKELKAKKYVPRKYVCKNNIPAREECPRRAAKTKCKEQLKLSFHEDEYRTEKEILRDQKEELRMEKDAGNNVYCHKRRRLNRH